MHRIDTLLDLWHALDNHDWDHAYSDSGAVDRAGADNWQRIVTAAGHIGGGKAMLDKWLDYRRDGGTKPPLPKDYTREVNLAMKVMDKPCVGESCALDAPCKRHDRAGEVVIRYLRRKHRELHP